MNKSQMFTEALRLLSDPKAIAAIQSATAPLVEKLQQSKANLQSGKDPLTSLFDILNGAEKSEEAAPVVEELTVEAIKQSLGKVFLHNKSGDVYLLVTITNEHSTDKEKFPVTAVYMNCATRQTWSRPLAEFAEKFKLI